MSVTGGDLRSAPGLGQGSALSWRTPSGDSPARCSLVGASNRCGLMPRFASGERQPLALLYPIDSASYRGRSWTYTPIGKLDFLRFLSSCSRH
jgi:hypothetical protein